MNFQLRRMLAGTAISASLHVASFAAPAKSQPPKSVPMSVAQLRQTLAEASAGHRHGDALLRQLANVTLTARLTSSTLQQLIAASPSPATARALQYLAGASAFLDPPADEVPQLPRPDPVKQRVMVEQAIHYVARTLPNLPNFLATRVTEQLLNSTPDQPSDQNKLIAGFFLKNVTRTSIAFTDGKETEGKQLLASENPSGKKARQRELSHGAAEVAPPAGLTSHGEFGPMLAVIMLDAAKGKLRWVRWEEIGGKPVAVFQFAVDRSASHFTVSPWQVPIMEFAGSPPQSIPSSTDSPGGALDGIADLLEGEILSPGMKAVAYRGQVALDPDNGTILRIAVEAEPLPEDAVQFANIMVEYAPVKMGAEFYVCPVHSVAISRSSRQDESTQAIPFPGSTNFQLNDVKFTDYRRFGSQSTVLVPPSQ